MNQPGTPGRGVWTDGYGQISQQQYWNAVFCRREWRLSPSALALIGPLSLGQRIREILCVKKFKHFFMFADHFISPVTCLLIFLVSFPPSYRYFVAFLGQWPCVWCCKYLFVYLVYSLKFLWIPSVPAALKWLHLSRFSEDVWVGWLFRIGLSRWRNTADLLISYGIISLVTFSVNSGVNVEPFIFY